MMNIEDLSENEEEGKSSVTLKVNQSTGKIFYRRFRFWDEIRCFSCAKVLFDSVLNIEKILKMSENGVKTPQPLLY